MMNILIVTTEIGFDGGGMSLSCQKLYETLQTVHKVKVIYSNEYPIASVEGKYVNLPKYCINKEYKLKQETIKFYGTNLVIGFGGRYNGYYASLLAQKLHCKFILSLRGSDINLAKWSVEDTWYLQQACKQAEHIVCLSEEMRQNIKLLSEDFDYKIKIIPNEVSFSGKEVTFPNLPNSIIIGSSAAHLNEKKGIANLINVVYELKNIISIPIKLELVGSIDNDLLTKYKNIACKNNVTEQIIFVGYESREAYIKRLGTWDFYIQSSVCEGHPNSVVESINNGTGIISTKTGYIAEKLSEHYPLMFFDNFDAKDMATKIFHLISKYNKECYYNKAYSALQKIECINNQNMWLEIVSCKKIKKETITFPQIITVALHDIDEYFDNITTPYVVFEKFCEDINNIGFKLCSMNYYIQAEEKERKKLIVCTFDDGYQNLYNIALPIMKKYAFNATIFMCTDFIGKDNSWNCKDGKKRNHLNMDSIISLRNEQWEIASHGVAHQNLLKLSDSDLEYELSKSKERLLEIVGYANSYAYPYGAYNEYIKTIVSKYYKYAFAVSTGGTNLQIDNMQIRRYTISEIYKMAGLS